LPYHNIEAKTASSAIHDRTVAIRRKQWHTTLTITSSPDAGGSCAGDCRPDGGRDLLS
jgi:hypothetical protein